MVIAKLVVRSENAGHYGGVSRLRVPRLIGPRWLLAKSIIVLNSRIFKLSQLIKGVECHEFFFEVALIELLEVPETKDTVLLEFFLKNLPDLILRDVA